MEADLIVLDDEDKARIFSEDSAKIACEVNTGCWLWTGTRNAGGYGLIRNLGRDRLAHRMSYETHKGNIPAGLLVMHKCDTPSCVNPQHLDVGTHLENNRDSIKKGRAHFLKPIAEDGSDGGKTGAKFSPGLIREVRRRLAAGERRSHISRTCGVSESHISSIRTGKNWSWFIPGEISPDAPLVPRTTHNVFTILSHLRLGGAMYVSDIAKASGLRAAKLYDPINVLVSAGLISAEMEERPVRRLRCRRRLILRITDDGSSYLEEYWPKQKDGEA